MRTLVLGSLSVTGLTDINSFSLPVKTLFPSFDDKILNEKEALDPKVISNGLIHLTIRSWLLRQFGQNILIDCCVGANKNRPNHPNWHKRDGKDWLNVQLAAILFAEHPFFSANSIAFTIAFALFIVSLYSSSGKES